MRGRRRKSVVRCASDHTAEQACRLASSARPVSAEGVRGALLWLTAFAGAFFFVEPSPYELMAIATMLVFAVGGLAWRPALMPLVALLTLINVGYAIAVVPVSAEPKSLLWVFVSLFLALTVIFYAALVETNLQRRVDLLFNGTIAAAGDCLACGAGGLFPPARQRVGQLCALRPRPRHLQRSERARCIPGISRAAAVSAPAGRSAHAAQRRDAGNRCCSTVISFSRGAWAQYALRYRC